jgi:nitrite reductase/ring-hydroxylating ferredoxin subunit
MSSSLSDPLAQASRTEKRSAMREISVGRIEDFEENAVVQLAIAPRFIALYRLEGEEFYATDDVCTHGQAFLSEGWITDECTIECPLHGGCFDIRTGKAVEPPVEVDIATFPVRVENGEVFLTLSDE